MKNIFLQLGSNLGQRVIYINKACDMIANEIGDILESSKIYESTPWGVENQNNYLNKVINIESHYNPNEILMQIMDIENRIGRVRHEKWGERVIDIDIIFYNNNVIESEGLCIPHMHMHKRKFVLLPLIEIASNFIHPRYHKNISTLLQECDDTQKVHIYAK